MNEGRFKPRFESEDDGSTTARSGTSWRSGSGRRSLKRVSAASIQRTTPKKGIIPLTDGRRHLICVPYDLDNLFAVARNMGIHVRWFHKDHFDVPIRRRVEIEEKCLKVTPRQIVLVIQGRLTYDDIVAHAEETNQCVAYFSLSD